MQLTTKKSVLYFANLAENKSQELKFNPIGFAISCLLAGAYIGFGIILIFSIGQYLDTNVRSLTMGVSFGIALTLVVFAGSELFTGHTMFTSFGWLCKTISIREALGLLLTTWFGNLLGAIVLSLIFVLGGCGVLDISAASSLLISAAEVKVTMPSIELLARGMLCNWLVCLALWSSARTESDTAKCILIFWCLFVFIAAGFEHSIANMTVFSIVFLLDYPGSIELRDILYNLAWVSLGNFLSGACIVGFGYWVTAGKPAVIETISDTNELVDNR